MTVPPEAVTAAARAYCLHRYGDYDGPYVDAAARERHITADAEGTAREPWLTHVLEAAAPLIAAAEHAETERWKLNARRMALLAEAFVYEPQRITEGGLMAQIHRVLTDQDIEWDDQP